MLCPEPLLAFLGRVMRGDLNAVSSTLIRFSWTGYERGNIYMLCPAPLLAFLGRVMRGEIDAVSSTLIRFPWTSYERGDRCCVQHPYSLFLERLREGR